MPETKMKPCPFCGGKNLRRETSVIDSVVGCFDCRLYMYRNNTKDFSDGTMKNLIKSWNRRLHNGNE